MASRQDRRRQENNQGRQQNYINTTEKLNLPLWERLLFIKGEEFSEIEEKTMIPKVGSDNISFNSQVKRLFKKGKLKGVKYGLYGDELNIKNVTDEHVIPKSWGGKNTDDNIALASREKNNLRGNKPLSAFLTAELLEQYVNQFMHINLPEYGFKGKVYVQNLLRTINKALDVEKHFKIKPYNTHKLDMEV